MVDKVCGSLDITDKCKFTRYCTSQNALKIEWMPDNKVSLKPAFRTAISCLFIYHWKGFQCQVVMVSDK